MNSRDLTGKRGEFIASCGCSIFAVIRFPTSIHICWGRSFRLTSPRGGFAIVQHDEASCRPLNAEAIDEIVEKVDRWYDAFFAKASQKTPPKKRIKRFNE